MSRCLPHSVGRNPRRFSAGEVQIHAGIDSTLLILKHRLKANNRRPEIKIIKKYGLLPEVNCFPGQLNQVFMNILGSSGFSMLVLLDLTSSQSFQPCHTAPKCSL